MYSSDKEYLQGQFKWYDGHVLHTHTHTDSYILGVLWDINEAISGVWFKNMAEGEIAIR